MRRFAAVLVLVCGLAAPAEAVSLRDLVDLSKQGLGDDLLIALVEAEKSVFHLSAADVKSLKEQGLSDRLLIHLLQTPSLRPDLPSRLYIADAPAPAPASEPAPVVVIEHIETIAVPVYVPVPMHRAHRRPAERAHDDGRDSGEARRPSKRASAEYWGYGGTLRPDAWGQPRNDPKKDPKKQ